LVRKSGGASQSRMGGAESKPPYVHDFCTNAALNAQQLYSAKPPQDSKHVSNSIHSKSHMLADAFMIQKVKAIEASERHVSVTTGGAAGSAIETAGHSAYAGDGPIETALKKAHAFVQQVLPKYEDLEQPHVPADHWPIRQAQATPFKATDGRNRYNLMSAPDSEASAKLDNVGHSQIDSWMMQDSIKAKQHTNGAMKKEWVGVPSTKFTTEDYMLKESLAYTKACTPNRKELVAVGIKPSLPVGGHHAYIQGEQIAKRAAIEDANRLQNLPAPKYGPDSYMVEHAEHVQRIVAYNLQAPDPDRPPPESPTKTRDASYESPMAA